MSQTPLARPPRRRAEPPEIKGADELACMREAGAIVRECLELAGRLVAPGVTTADLDRALEAHMRSRGSEPAFKGYQIPGKGPYPASICASVNEQVVHGIPGKRKLEAGDIIGVDVGVIVRGYHGDAARTFAVGKISEAAQRLIDATREALAAAVAEVGPGVPVSTLSRAIQTYAESRGYAVVKSFVGHGIGRRLHEEPQVPNFVPPEGPEDDCVLRPGMVIAIEPMLNIGGDAVQELADRWTVVTRDRTLSAHFEDTVAVVPGGRELLTVRPGAPAGSVHRG